jgi:DNA invertase Pin-like site-specific DNA recombinase
MSESDSSKSPRGVLYLRMSGRTQEKSIPQQRAEMRPRCQLEGLALAGREFKDEAKSGGGMRRRDDFLDMLRFCQDQHARGEPVEAIACYDTSRFSRATSIETAHYIWEFQQAGVHRVLTHERWFDFRKEEDRAIFLLQQDFTNNRYLRDHGKRVARGKKDAALLGRHNGGLAPYGLDRLLMNKRGEVVRRVRNGEKVGYKEEGWWVALTPGDDEAKLEVVRWLYEKFDAGVVDGFDATCNRLASILNGREVSPPGKPRKRERAYWNEKTVRNILTNPAYRGGRVYGVRARGAYAHVTDKPITHDGLHDGIVEAALWDRVQEKLKAQTKPTPGRRPTYALGGLLRCGQCGAPMHGNTHRYSRDGKHYGPYVRYMCQTAKGGGKHACSWFAVREDRILPLLVGQLLDVYLSPQRLGEVRERLRQKVQNKYQTDPARSERVRKRIAEKDAEIRDAVKALLRFPENADLLNEELTAKRQERERLRKDLMALERDQAVPLGEMAGKVDEALAKLEQLREDLEGMTRDLDDVARGGLRNVLRQLIVRVDLYWTVEQKKRRVFRFSRGVIKLRPALELTGSEADA